MKGYYINCIKHSNLLTKDIKEIVPDMNLRRRMSKVVKMGVLTGIESVIEFEEHGNIDAIITASGLGCISDSEKFLANLITSNEQMLNPTPFIQSTFNTVGAQIALIKSLHCYNNTFTHRYTSFESAIIDAGLRINSLKADAVLVGIFDEAAPTVEGIMTRMGLLKDKILGEGSIFFVLTKEKMSCSVAEIVDLSFDREVKDGMVSVSNTNNTIWSGAVAQTIFDMIYRGESGVVVNDLGGEINSLIELKCF